MKTKTMHQAAMRIGATIRISRKLCMHTIIWLCVCGIFTLQQAYAQSTQTFSYSGSTQTVDGTSGFVDVLTVDVPTSAFPANYLTTDVNIVVNYDKTDGSCASTGTGNSFHDEHGFQIQSPVGTQITIFAAGSFSGSTNISPGVTQTFDDEAGSAIPGGVPANGTYRPNTAFTSFDGQNPEGTWTFRATETAGGDPLCVIGVDVVVTAQDMEMEVQGNSVTITDGDATPTSTDHTDFGSADVTGGMVDRVFTINNTGGASLSLSGSPIVSVGGTHSGDFSVTSQPSASIAAGGSSTFTVRFDPTATGTRSATLSIDNDDANENPYNFSIQGTGATLPEMSVSGNSTTITDGDTSPSGTDHTDFGVVNSGSTLDRVFTVTNTGGATLNLNGSPTVSISGDTEFTVTAQPATTVASGGGTTTFTVRFAPTSNGNFSATVSIDNDDSDENPYNFSISGTSVVAPGDQTGSIVYWIKADAGVTHSSNEVDQWADQSPSGFNATGSGGTRPTLQTNQVNSYPSIDFDGNDFLDAGNNMNFDPGVDSWSFFSVFNVNTNNTGTLLSRGTGGTGSRQYQYYISGNDFRQIIGGNNNSQGTATATGNWRIGSAILSTTTLNSYVDGTLDDPGTPGTAANQTTNVIIGARSSGTGFILTGDIAEIVMYNTNLGASAQRDVESYLAIKYGITLDISSTAYTIGGSSIYTGNTTFDNDIIGIGQDDSQGLDQTTSQSVNTGGILSLSGATSQDDGDFLVMAHNNGTAGTLGSSYNGGTTNGSNRIWRVEETNDVGTITITVNQSDVPSSVTHLYVKNNDAALGTGGTAYALTDNTTTWTVNVDFSNNDNFSFITTPEMEITGNSVTITDGDTTPSSGDHTDFGDVDVSTGSVIRTFTINNSGPGILTLGSNAVSLSGTHSADYTVNAQPATTVASGGNTTFQVTFDPSAAGTRSASISVANDDLNESPYNFSIQGNGVVQPEMSVSGNSVTITDGDTTPSTADHTDFGNVFSGTLARVFTISNSGGAVLNLSGTPIVDISGSSDFSISVQPSGTTVASGGGTTTFTVLFNPTSEGVKTASISITNDDADENPYNFNVQGSKLSLPGNVSASLGLWLKADVGVSSSSNSVFNWADQSGNSNNAAQATSAQQPTVVASSMNGNPAIIFDGSNDDLAGSAGFNTHDYFMVLDPDEIITNDNGSETPLGYSSGSTNNAMALGAFGSLTNEVITHSINTGTYQSGLQSTTVSFSDPFLVNFKNNSGATQQELFLDGAAQTESTTGTFSNLTNVAYSLGENTEGSAAFGGKIAEVISFGSRLTDAQRRDVASYLAIKYGITLDISSQNYTVEGSSIYNNSSYTNDIAGIGRDDSQGLNQTSSRSINSGSLVSIGNAGSLGDGDFLVWGNDGGSTATTTSNVPGGTTERLTRIWRVDQTNTVGTVDVVFDVTSLPIDAANSTFNLIIAASGASMPTGLSSASVSAAGTVNTSSGTTTVTFSGILLGDNEFFTLAGTFVETAPGDQGANLSLWLRGDDGVVQSSNSVSSWIDKSGNGNNAAQENSGDQPTYTTDQLNGYPMLSFDGNDFMILGDVLNFVPQTNAFSAFTVFNTTGTGTLIGRAESGTQGSRQYQLLVNGGNYDQVIGGTLSSGSATVTGSWQIGASVVSTSNTSTFMSGAQDINASGIGTASETGANVLLGARTNGTGFIYTGDMAEVIMFNTNLSTTARRDVETYLAIKYGLTLNIASQDYTVGGSSIYTHNSYTNDIAGIGVDNSQGLSQTTSQSSNSATIVRMQNASAMTDGEFMVWGNDNGGYTSTTSNVPGGTTDRLTQIWRVDETGDIGTVDVVFDITALALNPNTSTFNLIIAGSGASMPTGLSSASVSSAGTVVTNSGTTTVTFSGVNFNDNEFFTLAGTFTSEAPGDISSNITLWLKADNGPVVSGGVVTDWSDRSGSNNSATQAVAGSRPTLSSSALNGNNVVQFDGTDDYLAGSAGLNTTDYFIVVSPNDLIFGDVFQQGTPIGYNNGNALSGIHFGSIITNFANEAVTYLVSNAYAVGHTGTTVRYEHPMIINAKNNAADNAQELFIDGVTVNNATAGTYTNFSGDYNLGANASEGNLFAGGIAEVISYSTRLSDANRRDVETYLAIKYGISLNIASQNYTVGGSSIYNNTTYATDIAGIGQNDSQGLNQSSSTSESGQIVTVSNPSSLADGDYLVWGSDGTAISLTTSNVPGGTTNRLARIWRADETNDVGTVNVAFDISALGISSSGTFNLIVATSGSTMPTGLSSATVSSAGTVSTIDGKTIVTFTGITINDGEFFTLAGNMSQPAPGDISANLTVWLKADAGVIQSGSNVTDWLDQSGNQNHASQTLSSSQPAYVSDGLNGNGAVSFDGSNTMTGSAGFHTQEYIIVVDPNEIYNNINAVGRIVGFEPGNFSCLSLGPSTALQDNEIITHAPDGGSYRSMQVSTTSNFGDPSIIASHNNAGATGQEIDRNGARVDNTELNAGSFANLSNQGYQLGESFNAAVSAPLNGAILEMISYSSTLSAANRRDVNTYLAIKYGISLDISSLNYTVGGSSIYNHTTYGSDIAGIGVNDSQGLNQLTSQSVNDGSLVKVQSASGITDGEYLVWGNDGGTNSFTTSNVPAGVIQRLTKIWRIDETGDVGTVTISFDLTTLGVDVSNTTMNLIISPTSATMPTGLSTGTLITGGTVSKVNGRDLVTFTGVDFSDGDYFTIGGDVQTTAPGGVSTNLTLWLRGDDGVTSSSNSVSNWSDKSGNGNDSFQGNSSSQPTLVANSLNYHDVINFNNDFLEGPSGFNTHDYFVVTVPSSTISNGAAFGYLLGFTQRNNNGLVLGAETGLLTNEVVSHITSDASSNTYASGEVSTSVNYSGGNIFNSRNNSGATGQEFYANGGLLTVTQANAGNFTNYTNDIYILGDNITNSSSFNGNIAEVISYSARLSDADRRSVASYLALRYGLTLNISSQSYTDGATTIYNNTSYANDIAGIGQNLDNGLSQTQSISSNSGAIIKMENASTLGNGDYVIWGNDGGDKSATQTSELASGYDQRLTTEWQVDVTGTPGTVTVKVNLSGVNGFTALTSVASAYTLLVDDDNNFSADLVSTTSGSSFSGDTLIFNTVTFADNNFFTVALPIAPSPGDVGTNLALWLKADSDVTQASSVVSDWTDQSGNNNDATQGTSSARPGYTTNALNGNPVIDFDGADDELGGISGAGFYTHDYFIVFSPDNTVSNSSSAEAVLGYSAGAENGLFLGSNFGGLTNEVITHYVTSGLSYGRAQTSASATYSGYLLLNSRNNSGATQQELYVDGTQIDNASSGSIINLSDADYVLGDRFSGGLSFNGKIAEVISYSARISMDANRRDVESYLALKYGMTLNISGSDPFDAYTVEGSEVYNRTSYANDIAGIGINGSQELNQMSSKSINSDAIITLSSASALSDGDYIIWGNDNGATGTTTSGLPTGATERMTRVWGVNETGDAGTVTVSMDLTGLGYGAKVVGDFRLILDSDNNFSNGVSNLVTPQSYTSNVLTFSGVDFTGVTHFGLVTAINIALDTDTDGIPDYFEAAYGTNASSGDSPVSGGAGGTDTNSTTGINGDGISDALETILDNNGATAPITRGTDTDADGIPDYLEVANGTDPFDASSPTSSGSTDTDNDGIPDALEALIASEGGASNASLDTDTDGDGIVDYYEVMNGTNPGNSNSPLSGGGSAVDTNDATGSSGDGISDALENILIAGGATAPVETTTDTDGDGIPDYIEAQTMSDPFNSASPAASGTPAVRSLQADYQVTGGSCTNLSGYQWVDITDNLGNLVFSINPVGNNLGSTCWAVRVVNSADDMARNDGTDYVLDRNWYIIPTTQPSSSVYIRFYTLSEEHVDLADQLLASESFTYSDSDLRITKISGIDNLDPFVTGGTRSVLNPTVANYSTNGRSLTIGITSFSTFDPHVNPDDPNAPLPITLIGFEAELVDDKVLVSWSTASEINNEFFTIERSVDGVNFEEVEYIPGAGDSNTRIDYQYVDNSPIVGTSYYRLKQTDFDGQFSYSDVRRIDNYVNHLAWNYYPNPTSGWVSVSVNEDLFTEYVSLKVTDLAGKEFNIPFNSNSNKLDVDLSSLVPGVYIMEIQANGITNTSRIVKR